MHIRFTAIRKYIVSLSSFVSLSLTSKKMLLQLEVGMEFKDLYNKILNDVL